MVNNGINIGKLIKHQRTTIPMTLQELAAVSGVSPSYVGRIERGQRFPSARVLRKIAKPLGFDEDELFTLAGYLSPSGEGVAEKESSYIGLRLDSYVARVLSQEPVRVQRTVIAILTIMKSLAKITDETDKGDSDSPSGVKKE